MLHLIRSSLTIAGLTAWIGLASLTGCASNAGADSAGNSGANESASPEASAGDSTTGTEKPAPTETTAAPTPAPTAPPEPVWHRLTTDNLQDLSVVEVRFEPNDAGGTLVVRVTPGAGFYIGGDDYPPTTVAVELPEGLSVDDAIQTTREHIDDGFTFDFAFTITGKPTPGALAAVTVTYVSCTTDGEMCLPPARMQDQIELVPAR
jgi:hypothetical protein